MTRGRTTRAELREWLTGRDRLVIAGCGLAVGLWSLRAGYVAGFGFGLLGAAAAAITYTDRRKRLIPDMVSLPLIPLGLAVTLLRMGRDAAVGQLVAVVALIAALRLISFAMSRWRGKVVMGGGDIKLIAVAGAWLNPVFLPNFILAAALTGLGEAGLLRGRNVAFGCHLAPWLVGFVVWQAGLLTI